MTEENFAGAKPEITQKKLDNLFYLFQTYKKPSLVASFIGVDTRTLNSWVEKGNEILSQHKEFNAELTDCVLDGLVYAQEHISENREDYLQKFLEKTKATELGVKNTGRFDEFLDDIAQKELEEYTHNAEIEMIDNYQFSEHDGKNETLKKYVKVARIVTRATLAIKGKYLSNVDKHASTGKNVNLSKWMLEVTDDEFRPKPNTSVNIENNNGSISFIGMLEGLSKMGTNTEE